MRYSEYKENRIHKTRGFPFAYYHVTSIHSRYTMVYHWHPEYELIRVLKGSLQMRLDGSTVSIQTGDMMIAADGVLHGGIPHDCVYECIVFNMQTIFPPTLCDEDMRSILQHKKTIKRLLTADTDACAHLHDMFEAMATRAKGYHHQVLASLHGFLCEVIRQELYEPSTLAASKGRKQMVRLKNALELIHSDYHESLSLSSIADAAQMDQKYFCRYFRSIIGKTPMNYLNYYRVECACERILLSEKSMTDIAMDCGFNDSSYFVKVFKRYKGITPSQYARQVLLS